MCHLILVCILFKICFFIKGTSFGCLLTSLILSTNLNNDQVSGTKPPPGPQEHCGSAFCQHGGLTPEESAGGASAGQLPQILQSLLTPSDTGEAADLHQADTSSDTKADEVKSSGETTTRLFTACRYNLQIPSILNC